MLQKIIGQFTRDVRLYNDEKIQNLASRFPSENSPDGQRMIMYMLLFSWYTRNTILPFTADQIVSLVNSIIDVYYDPKYQQMNDMMISLIRNDLQRMSFWSNEYIFKTFFNDDFIKESNDQLYVNLEYLSTFNQWILQDRNNVEFYNYSHLLVQKCNKLQYVHNYTIMISDEVPQNVVQAHCPSCQTINRILKDDFLNMCRNYEKSYVKKFSKGISIYCHKCNSQINFIELYGNVKTLYGGMQPNIVEKESFNDSSDQLKDKNGNPIDCDKIKFDKDKFTENVNYRIGVIENGKTQAKMDSLQSLFEQFAAVVQNQIQNNNGLYLTYQEGQQQYESYMQKGLKNIKLKQCERIISNINEEIKPTQNINNGLKIIFDYFIKQQAEHTDVFFYSGKPFITTVQKEVISQYKTLNENTKKQLEQLKKCLKFVQGQLKQNYLQLISDDINDNKLEKENYKLLKLYSSDQDIRKNNYYKTIYFVSYSNYTNLITTSQKITDQYEQNEYTYSVNIANIPRSNIKYISLCHGGIVIQLCEKSESTILNSMITTIDILLHPGNNNNSYLTNVHGVTPDMKKFVLFIVIVSQYEKNAYKNYKTSEKTLRDDLRCYDESDDQSKSNSFYKTFMQLYYNMLLWDGEGDDFDVGFDDNNKDKIKKFKKAFILYYQMLKKRDNPRKDKYLSFLMTLYTYDNELEELMTKYTTENENICKCLIQWVRDFVKHMLTNVYGDYTKEKLDRLSSTMKNMVNEKLLEEQTQQSTQQQIQQPTQQQLTRKEHIEERKQKINAPEFNRSKQYKYRK